MPIKNVILVVEDEHSIRSFISAVLTANGYEVLEATRGADAYMMITSHCPDLVLLDLGLPDMDGMKIIRSVREWSQVPIVVVSARTHERDKVEALDAGADDYLAKPFGVLELVARINAKLRSSKKSGGAISYKDVVIDCDKREVTVGGRLVALTLKQYELLKLLAENAGKVLERDFLLDNVWGENYGETRTLDIHVGELRKVLSSSDSEIATVRGVGYVLK